MIPPTREQYQLGLFWRIGRLPAAINVLSALEGETPRQRLARLGRRRQPNESLSVALPQFGGLPASVFAVEVVGKFKNSSLKPTG